MRLSTEERKQQLLELGLELFNASPYDELSIDAIAKAADISKGLLYHYFKSKRAFYLAVVASAAEQLTTAIEAATETIPEGDSLQRLDAGIDAFLTFVQEHAGAFRFLMRSAKPSDDAVAEIIEGVRSELIDKFVHEGTIPVSPIAAEGIIAFIEATSLRWLEDGGDREKVKALAIRVSVAAIAPV